MLANASITFAQAIEVLTVNMATVAFRGWHTATTLDRKLAKHRVS